MSHNTGNKYLFAIYRQLAIKFDQYLQHVSAVTGIDECCLIFSNNSSIILGSKHFGITFEVPCNLVDLSSGKVGEMTSEHITAYYSNIVGCDIIEDVEYVAFKCESMCTPLTYPDHLPQLCNDIPQNTVRADELWKIKEIITQYRDFYQFLAKKHFCYSEKSYDSYCKSDTCCEGIKYCCERKKCGCEKKCCCTTEKKCDASCCGSSCKKSCCDSGCTTNCHIECKVKCEVECKSKCENKCKPKCSCCKPKSDCCCKPKPCYDKPKPDWCKPKHDYGHHHSKPTDCGCSSKNDYGHHKKSYDGYNNWITRKCW
jgi:hypothetical protein